MVAMDLLGCEEERGEAEPRAGLGEREERGGVGRAQRGLEAGGRGREVAAALGLVGQREEALRGRRRRGHGGDRHGGGASSRWRGRAVTRARWPAWG